LNSKGEPSHIYSNGWQAYGIEDPIRYGRVLSLKIRDPEGRVRLFNDHYPAHYENRFFNNIKNMMELVKTVQALASYKNWKEIEGLIKEDATEVPPLLQYKLRNIP
jgi:hypothetical protein